MNMPATPLLYFAYGHDLDKNQMKQRAPESRPRVTAVLPNYRLAFFGWSRQWKSGIVTLRGTHGSKVSGGIYEITEKDLRRLDSLEGYPRESNRINITVFTEDGDAFKAVTYIKVTQSEETKPSPEYLAVIQKGYRDWGIV
jgi:gamma-glutamylcyclotransferase